MTKFSYFLGSEQWQPEDLIKHAEIAKDSGFDMLTISKSSSGNEGLLFKDSNILIPSLLVLGF